MKRFLIVVDMQKDFVDGALGSPAAVAIVPRVVDKIVGFVGEVIATYHTHTQQYMDTNEGSHLPGPHCIKGADGWQLDAKVADALTNRTYHKIEKPTFGSTALPDLIRKIAQNEDFTIELVGLCTDICVVSNALLLKANFPEHEIFVDAACCAGVSDVTHRAALATMKCCQIQVTNE